MGVKTQATEVQTWDALEVGSPGAYMFAVDGQGEVCSMISKCAGCGQLGSMRIRKAGEGHVDGSPSWEWNGSRDKPTLRPSVKEISGCQWHGYLTDGVWETC